MMCNAGSHQMYSKDNTETSLSTSTEIPMKKFLQVWKNLKNNFRCCSLYSGGN